MTMPKMHETIEPRSIDDPLADEEQVQRIVARGPTGAFAVAGVATAIVVLLYLAFYAFVYLPRGTVQ